VSSPIFAGRIMLIVKLIEVQVWPGFSFEENRHNPGGIMARSDRPAQCDIVTAGHRPRNVEAQPYRVASAIEDARSNACKYRIGVEQGAPAARRSGIRNMHPICTVASNVDLAPFNFRQFALLRFGRFGQRA
jgi:hypothetical protein